MKWYNQRAYKQHIKDLKHLDVADWRKRLCLEFVNSVANTFDTTYPRIGVLDINDLIQEGYLSALSSWKTLNWDAIKAAPEEEWQPIIWNYIKTGIRHGIINAIIRGRESIRIPRAFYFEKYEDSRQKNQSYQTDIFLSRTFSSFFNEDYAESIEYQGESYQNEQLNLFLNDILDKFLDEIAEQVIKMSFGINENNDVPKSFEEISDRLKNKETKRKKPSAIRKIKQRGIDKLKQEEVIEQIENYLLNAVTN